MQNKKKVYTLGPEGSFHHLSCVEYLGGQQEIAFCESFAGIFEAVKAGHLGWIALYNSVAGVVENHEAEIQNNYTLLDEMDYEVKLCIGAAAGTQLSAIDTIYSHEKALGESKRFTNNKLPKAATIQCSSTSAAAKKVAHEGLANTAAICHAETAKFYRLTLIANIPNKRKNETSFALFTRK